MRWKGRRKSENVEDARGSGGGGAALSGGGLLLLIGVILVVKCMGGDPQPLVDTTLQQIEEQAQQGGRMPQTQAEQERAEFIAVVLADTEDVWHKVFRDLGRQYREPGLRLFTRGTASGCGFASAAVGPFYCPADEKVYLDLSFFEELSRRFGAPGDFAQAYVLAHEVGHHVQRLLGSEQRMRQAQRRGLSKNEASVRLELQADFLAGVFAHHIGKKGYLEKGDIREAITAANAIGDDRLQLEAQGRVRPDSFTHGTSEQRMNWFALGYQTGDVRYMDTFDDAHFATVNRGG
jgi:predicted metalloprotease